MENLILKTKGSVTSSNCRKINELSIRFKKMGDGSGILQLRFGTLPNVKSYFRTKNGNLRFFKDAEGLTEYTIEELEQGIKTSPYNVTIYIKCTNDDILYVNCGFGGIYQGGRSTENHPLIQLDLKEMGYNLLSKNVDNGDAFMKFGHDRDYILDIVQHQYDIIGGTIEDIAITARKRTVWSTVYNLSGSNGTLTGSVVSALLKFGSFTGLCCLYEKNIKEECINPILGLPAPSTKTKRGYAVRIAYSNLYVDFDAPISPNGDKKEICGYEWIFLDGTKSRGDLSVCKKGFKRFWAGNLVDGYSFSWKGGPNYQWDADAANFSEFQVDFSQASADEIDDFIVSVSKSKLVTRSSNFQIRGTCSYTNPSSLRHAEVLEAVDKIKGMGAKIRIV